MNVFEIRATSDRTYRVQFVLLANEIELFASKGYRSLCDVEKAIHTFKIICDKAENYISSTQNNFNLIGKMGNAIGSTEINNNDLLDRVQKIKNASYTARIIDIRPNRRSLNMKCKIND